MSSRTILSESVWQVLNEDTRQYLNEWDQLGNYIKENIHVFEAELTPDQIDAVFNNAEQYAVDSGKFTSKLGKSANAAAQAGAAAVGGVKLAAGVVGKINQKLNDLGRVIQDTTPVKGIDAAFEKAKKDLYDKLGGKDSKVNQVIMKASQLAKDHPGKTKMLVGALTLAASLAAGPAGGAAAGYVLRGASDLLAGEKISTAVGKGLKTAALGYLSGKAFEFAKEVFQDIASPEDIAAVANDPEQVAAAAKKAGEAVTPKMPFRELSTQGRMMDLQDMNDTMKDVGGQMGLKPPFEANFQMGVPVEINGVPVPQDILSGVDPVIPGENFKELRAAWRAENGIAAPTDAGSAFDKLDAAYETAKLKYMSGLALTESEQQVLEIGPLAAIGGAAARGAKAIGSAVAKGARAVGKQLGQTVTARKLKSLWKDGGSPTDAASISQVLSKAGLGADDVAAVAKASKVSLPAAPKAAKPAAGAKKPAGGEQPQQPAAPAQAAPAGGEQR